MKQVLAAFLLSSHFCFGPSEISFALKAANREEPFFINSELLNQIKENVETLFIPGHTSSNCNYDLFLQIVSCVDEYRKNHECSKSNLFANFDKFLPTYFDILLRRLDKEAVAFLPVGFKKDQMLFTPKTPAPNFSFEDAYSLDEMMSLPGGYQEVEDECDEEPAFKITGLSKAQEAFAVELKTLLDVLSYFQNSHRKFGILATFFGCGYISKNEKKELKSIIEDKNLDLALIKRFCELLEKINAPLFNVWCEQLNDERVKSSYFVKDPQGNIVANPQSFKIPMTIYNECFERSEQDRELKKIRSDGLLYSMSANFSGCSLKITNIAQTAIRRLSLPEDDSFESYGDRNIKTTTWQN